MNEEDLIKIKDASINSQLLYAIATGDTSGIDDKNKKWLACSESCLTDKKMVGKSCTKCNHSEYGKL